MIVFCLLFLVSCGITTPPLAPTVPSTGEKVITPNPALADGKLRVHFIDVSQGEAILIDYGTDEVLIDGGRGLDAAQYIRSLVDGPLEVMVATSPNINHIGGLAQVLDIYDVEQIWLNDDFNCIKPLSDFVAKVGLEGADVYQAERGENIYLKNLTLTILNPAPPLYCNTYSNSIVLKLYFGEVDFLFTGNIDRQGEAAMLSAGLITNIDILKVSDHGSDYSTTTSFLEAAQPEIAIYTANRYDTAQPSLETLNRLEDSGAAIYGTDRHGSIVVVTDGMTYAVKPMNNVPPLN